MIFYTESGSAYQINAENKTIRRLRGNIGPTNRQGKDGEWKAYYSVSPIQMKSSVIIVWAEENGHGVIPTTITSQVQSIVEDEN